MPLRLMVFLCAAVLVSACSAPQAVDGPATALASTEASEDDPLICERVAVTGTRVAERVCVRRSVREKQKREGQEMLEEVQRRAAIDTMRRE